MSLKSYQDYKNSGVDFYKVTPAHWKVERLSTIAEFQSGKAHEPFITEDGEFICVNSRFVSTQGGSVKFCSENLTPTKINDILMVMSDLPNGRALAKAFYVDNEVPYAVNQRVCRIRAIDIEPKFLYYYMDRSPLLLRNDDGLNQTHLSNSDFKNCPVFIPSCEEQKSIASFLDHETIKIDILIAEQEKLIELLKDKRQAVISNAVTKGLHPNVKMKDSGVEWLGEVPTHWEIKKMKHVATASNGLTYAPENLVDSDEGTLVLRSSNIQDGKISLNDNVYVKMNIPPKSTVTSDDILICSRNGSRALIGKNALIPDELDGVAYGAFMMLLRSPISKYIYWILNSFIFKFQSSLFLTSTINQLTVADLYGFELPIPPLEEQQEISQYLFEQQTQLNQLIEKATKAIELLRERRSALIAEAVTGQIDVRNAAPKLEAA